LSYRGRGRWKNDGQSATYESVRKDETRMNER
jgi:hypothetical protein